MPLFSLASEPAPDLPTGEVLAGQLVGAVSADAAPVVLDTDEVTLDLGESAFVPAITAAALPAGSGSVLEVGTNTVSVAHAVPGVWDEDAGMLLIWGIGPNPASP